MPPRGKEKANALPMRIVPPSSSTSSSSSAIDPPPVMCDSPIDASTILTPVSARKRHRSLAPTQEDSDDREASYVETKRPYENSEMHEDFGVVVHDDFGVFNDYLAGLGKDWTQQWVLTEALEIAKRHLEKQVRESKRIEGDKVVFMDWSELVELVQMMGNTYVSISSRARWSRDEFKYSRFCRLVKEFGTELREKYGLGDDLYEDLSKCTFTERTMRIRRRQVYRMMDFGGYFPKQPIYRICTLCAECQDSPENERDKIFNPVDMERHQAVYHSQDEAMWRWISQRSLAKSEDRLCCLVCDKAFEERGELLDHMLANHYILPILRILPSRHHTALFAAIELQSTSLEDEVDTFGSIVEAKDQDETNEGRRRTIGEKEQDGKPATA